MIIREIKARFEEFPLSRIKPQNSSTIVPMVNNTSNSRYGTHAYYFMNLRTSKGICAKIEPKDIISPGLKMFKKANTKQYKFIPMGWRLFQKYHHGFCFPEQIMLMTVPHSVTNIGNGRFIISLGAYFGHLLVDCQKKSVVYKILDGNDELSVFGSDQWYDTESECLYYVTYSLKDSLRKVLNPCEKVFTRVLEYQNKTGETKELWSGFFADDIHDIVVNKNERYLVLCALGKFLDKKPELLPSRVLILDLLNNREWVLTSIPTSAHAQFDPDNPEIIYFSNHEIQLVRPPQINFFKKGTYGYKLRGPASVHKYRLEAEGPREIGVFSDPGLFRMTDFHVFQSNGSKILAAFGAPNFIFIADAENFKLIKKIEIKDYDSLCYVRTFAPSLGGQKLYIQTSRSFQIIDLLSEKVDFFLAYSLMDLVLPICWFQMIRIGE